MAGVGGVNIARTIYPSIADSGAALVARAASNTGAVGTPYRQENRTDTAQKDVIVPISTGTARKFFADLSAIKRSMGPVGFLDLVKFSTEVTGGKLHLKFDDGRKMALDAVVKELISRNIVEVKPVIVLPLDSNDKHNAVLIKYLLGISRQYNVQIILGEISKDDFI
ncbi:MAG: hypothetical protein ACK5PW_18595 [Burkholderiales bacterium]